jgi:hypothetical protein
VPQVETRRLGREDTAVLLASLQVLDYAVGDLGWRCLARGGGGQAERIGTGPATTEEGALQRKRGAEES